MSDQPPFDPRAVANMMLEIADEQGISLSHVMLQKLMYFAHGLSLSAGRPLVRGGFEAWTYGPVQPIVFQCFKGSGRAPLIKRATRTDIVTGITTVVVAPQSEEIRGLIRRVLINFGKMDASRLIALSHAKGGPWDEIVNKAKTSIALGMKIPDNVIKSRFARHKISVGENRNWLGEPYEDAPFT